MRPTSQRILRSLATLACLVALAPRAQAAPCADVFEQLYPEGGEARVRSVQGEPGNSISYGLEAEFNIQKAPGILDWYRPSSKTDDQWFAMSLDERKNSLNGSSGYGLVKTSRAPSWLKDQLSSDPGGAELITGVTDKLEEALSWVRQIEIQGGGDGGARSKAFYWQGNIAFKHDGAFARTNRDGIDGYVRATADYAQFGKLHTGYEVWERNPEFLPGKNLGHGVLGPLNTDKLRDIQNELTAASEGRNLSGGSHYIQGTYFRTWPYGPGRSGAEVRDAHKDVYVLRRELRRLTHGLEQGFAAYAPFKSLTVLDETAHFNQFSAAVQGMLRGLPSSYDGAEKFSVQAGRFALPMRPFESEYPTALGLSGDAATQLQSKITNARAEYVRTLEALAADSAMEGKAKLGKVRVAIAKFAHESGIYNALDSYFAGVGQRPAAQR
ncbi:MAG: hypothetical protein ACOY3Y_03870 [Acidobacteriota bacterium]